MDDREFAGERSLNTMKKVLTIAGSDCSGGAGIQADLKTIGAWGCYGMSVITAVTVQNTCGVRAVYPVEAEVVQQQFTAVYEDIFPDAVKIGMVSSTPLIEVIGEKLRFYQPKHIVVDPVMVATSGSRLISPDAVQALKRVLLPLATVLTPNLPEAEVLSGLTISSPEDMERAAKTIGEQYGCAVLCKGGHASGQANDLLWCEGRSRWFAGRRIHNPNTHGTGCTLSSAIAANLAKGYSLEQSVERAKDYVSGALEAMLDLGKGSGPLDHTFCLANPYTAYPQEI